MLNSPLYNFFIYKGEITPISDFVPSENTGGVYEVLRVSGGVPLFLEEHFQRFFASAKLAAIEMKYSTPELHKFLTELIGSNEISEGNILLSFKSKLKAFFIPHHYPDEKGYKSGVTCGILHAERENPHSKVFQTSVRHQANKMMEEQGFYEVLLVDHLNHVSEGSRSNVFFVDNEKLMTPPGKDVLLGITRQKTIMLAKTSGIPVVEKSIYLDDLPAFQAAFITGTSPKILPVSKINDWNFDPQNQLVQHLRLKYDKLIKEYVTSNRKT